MLIILAASLLPVLLLLFYIYRRDTFNKEPLPMLAKAFMFGILAAFLDVAVVSLFHKFIPHPVASPLNNALYTAIVEAAMPEELCKLAMLYICIWRSKYFDEYYDGIEYCAFVGLGFAGLENVLYVTQGGLELAFSRAMFAVPAHMFFAIFMGYFFSLARFRPRKRKFYFVLAYIVPVFLHATYDFVLMYSSNLVEDQIADSQYISGLLYIVFLFFFFILWRLAIRRVNHLSGQ